MVSTLNITTALNITNDLTHSPNSTLSSTSNILLPEYVQKVTGYIIAGVIGFVMIGMGCSVDLYKFKGHLLRPTGIVVGAVCQFIIMPAIGYALGLVADIGDLQNLALLIVGASPGGTFSNLAAYWVDGDIDLSVSMTVVSTILGFGMMPLMLFLYSLEYKHLYIPFQIIGLIMAGLLIPIFTGMMIKYKYPQYVKNILKAVSIIGGIALLLAVAVILVTFGKDLTISQDQIVCAIVFPGMGMILGYGVASIISVIPGLYLEHRHRRTICIETGIQNTQLAAGIIQISFEFKKVIQMILFPVFYLLSQMIWVVLLMLVYNIIVWKKQVGRSLSFDDMEVVTTKASAFKDEYKVLYADEDGADEVVDESKQITGENPSDPPENGVGTVVTGLVPQVGSEGNKNGSEID